MNVIKLNKGQYISNLEPFKSTGIPTNVMLYKEVTGCGITTYAYRYFKKHTIIIPPNKPVVEDKVAEHNAKFPDQPILGVYEGVDIEDIIDYLQSDVTYKKILTTPEGFISKVIPAFGDNLELMLNDYFLLLDECERIITDISYRGKIAAPMEWFFKFTHKAMVSATMLPFSDPRLDNFEKLYIKPTYNYCKPLTLIETNNVLESLRKRLEELNSDHVLIFLNSTDTIYAIAKRLDIIDQSNTYCSQKSANKLFVSGYRNGSSHLDTKQLVKYNFLTSRFFSAFDIKVDYKPDVIMITDVYFAEHSILDPQTEVIQIAGRCRNGVNSLTHITNFDSTITFKTSEEAHYYLNGCFDMYQAFIDFERHVDNPGARDMLRKAIEESIAHNFYSNGKINTFMIDNYINEERVRGYYQHIDHLKAAYALKQDHFRITHISELYELSDDDRKRINSGKTVKELRRELAHQLDRITPKVDYFPMADLDFINYVRKVEPRLTAAYDVIGFDGLEQTGYVYSKIDKAVKTFNANADLKNIAEEVYTKFTANMTYEETEVVAKLTQIRNNVGISGRTTATIIKKFFNARRSSRSGKVVWVLSEKLSTYP